ncbi:MAG TPA: ATPase, T2SS/T4P/T4SS family, partial [Bryobacteraceae bacterium]|nr:ATPase, T2SS/T4P/T4SS family [Bryobacteraceae bacterium]
MGFETILPFLRPVAPLLVDPEISEIMINPGSNVFIERAGRCERTGVTVSETQVRTAAVMIARHLGEDISEDRPLLDARLPDGSRVAAAFPPCSIGGAAITIRKFQRHLFTLGELVRVGTLPAEVAELLELAVQRRRNILISGGTGSGKTTLLNALAATISFEDRVVVIEDTAELHVGQPNQLRFETRREQGEIAGVGIRDLLRATLRHRPDRIIVGEVRGPEAFDLLQALNTGHAGSLTTIHANSAVLALNRLTTCVLMSNVGLPFAAIRSQIADAVGMIVHIGRENDGRRVVAEIAELEAYDFASDRFEVRNVYRPGGSHAVT